MASQRKVGVERIHNPYWQSKEEKYAINRIEGMSMYQAAIEAKLPESVAKNAGERIEPKADKLIKEALLETGVNSSVLAIAIKDALTAQGKYGADHKVRLEAVKFIAQIRGELESSTKVAVQINLPAIAVDQSAWNE